MIDARIKIRTIQPSDRTAVTELHRQHYWRSHCLLLNTEFYRWQFECAPECVALGGDQSLVAVDARDRLLCFLGLIPAQCSFQGRALRGTYMLSWLSPPEARGQGIGRRIMKFAADHFDFLFARSPRSVSLPIFRLLHFRYISQCSRWLAVLDPDATMELAIDGDNAALDRARARTVSLEGAAPAHIGSSPPVGAASLAQEVLANSLTFVRSNAYLHWRYAQHPCLRYVFVWIGPADAPHGLAVARVEDVAGRRGRVLRIVEFLAQPTHAKRLADAVLSYGCDQGCAFADLFGISEHFVSGFVAAGAFDSGEEPELRLPHLLQPWSADAETPGLLFYTKEVDLSGVRCIDDVSLIHVSKGDGNLDWPSWNPSAKGIGFAPAVDGATRSVA